MTRLHKNTQNGDEATINMVSLSYTQPNDPKLWSKVSFIVIKCYKSATGIKYSKFISTLASTLGVIQCGAA